MIYQKFVHKENYLSFMDTVTVTITVVATSLRRLLVAVPACAISY
jgi:hypothetical protein